MHRGIPGTKPQMIERKRQGVQVYHPEKAVFCIDSCRQHIYNCTRANSKFIAIVAASFVSPLFPSSDNISHLTLRRFGQQDQSPLPQFLNPILHWQ
jgi:hypothetical protein